MQSLGVEYFGSRMPSTTDDSLVMSVIHDAKPCQKLFIWQTSLIMGRKQITFTRQETLISGTFQHNRNNYHQTENVIYNFGVLYHVAKAWELVCHYKNQQKLQKKRWNDSVQYTSYDTVVGKGFFFTFYNHPLLEFPLFCTNYDSCTFAMLLNNTKHKDILHCVNGSDCKKTHKTSIFIITQMKCHEQWSLNKAKFRL